jgi:uncharacterized membrane protein
MAFKLYIIAVVVFFAIDMLWLGVIAKGFYHDQVGVLLKTNPNWIAAILFYLLFLVGLVVFVLLPAVEKQSIAYAIGLGAFFGCIAYATYDLTNLATLKDWPIAVTIVDMLWGSILSALVSGITYWLVMKYWA